MRTAMGTLRYGADFRLTVEVDEGLAALYRSLLPKHIAVNRPRWDPHITVVRAGKETPSIVEHWGRYEGEDVIFGYDPDIRIDPVYLWLNCWCDRLAEIREELGLPAKSRWTLPPSGGHQCFHLTIANKK
jgi:hypothetical protein